MDQNTLGFAEHFEELKKRLIYVILFFLISFAACYYFADDIYQFLLTPLSEYYASEGKQGGMIYTGLTEAFFTYLKLSMIAALFFTIPFFTIQFFSFVSPGLKKGEKKVMAICLVVTPMLFLAGAFVAYYFVFPSAWKFFLSFESASMEGLPIRLEARVSEYLSLSAQIILAFGIVFQIPIALTLLNRVGLIPLEWLKKQRRLAIVIIFIIAAIITPPDVFSQLVLAAVMILLYEISILLCIFLNKEKKDLKDA
jgi:sec-independent protein translocase protein TatC